MNQETKMLHTDGLNADTYKSKVQCAKWDSPQPFGAFTHVWRTAHEHQWSEIH